MKFNSNQEIIQYLHRHYSPIHRLSPVRLKEAEDLSRFFKFKKNDRVELGVEAKEDFF
jgi:hypothetical protein